MLEDPERSSTLNPSYQIYLTPELAKILEDSTRIASTMKDEFISTEHFLLSLLDTPGTTQETIARFKINKEAIINVLQEIRDGKITDIQQPKNLRH